MPRDPRHGRMLPSGERMGRVMAGILRAMRRHALATVRRGRVPHFEAYRKVIIESITPLYLHEFRRGEVQALRGARKRALAFATKDAGTFDGFAWDIFRDTVPDAVRRLVLDLAGSVVETTRTDIRDGLLSGLAGGESLNSIADRLAVHFDSRRAYLIGQTEASRAMHAGEVESIREFEVESGVRYAAVWLASSDACKVCEGLNGQRRLPGQPFLIHNSGRAAYRVVEAPPAHPSCFCSLLWEEVRDNERWQRAQETNRF